MHDPNFEHFQLACGHGIEDGFAERAQGGHKDR